MRKYFLLSLIIMLLGSYARVHHASSLITQPAPEPEEYAVYAAVLKEAFIGKGTKRLVIERHTSIDDLAHRDPNQMLERLSPLSKQTVEDFKSKNRQSYELKNKFNLQVEINFLTEDDVRELFKKRDGQQDGWKLFRQKYPAAGSIITLSRVGFNAERTQALMFVAHVCGRLCGQGNYILLNKNEGEWKVEKKSMTWIS